MPSKVSLGLVLVSSLRFLRPSQQVHKSSSLRSSALTLKSDQYWLNNELITWYCLDQDEHGHIESTIQIFELYTNLQFKYVQDIAQANIKIEITSNGPENGNSMVGKPATLSEKSYTMKLGKKAAKWTILHEFCHAIGFLHEHQSPLRSFSIDIEKASKQFGISREEVETEISRRYKTREVGICTLYDAHSIMHYELPRFVMVKRWFFKYPSVSQKNKVFSELDKAVLVLMYPRSQPHDEAPEWTIEHALDVAGVPECDRGDIIGDRSPDRIRDGFVAWNKKNRPFRCILM